MRTNYAAKLKLAQSDAMTPAECRHEAGVWRSLYGLVIIGAEHGFAAQHAAEWDRVAGTIEAGAA